MELSSANTSVVSSAYWEIFTIDLGYDKPLMLSFERICMASSLAVKMYEGMDSAQPCLKPHWIGIKAVIQPLTFTELIVFV